MEIWWVEDFLSGRVLENRHYATQKEAVDARNRLGYGLVKSYQFKDWGVCPNASRCSGCS